MDKEFDQIFGDQMDDDIEFDTMFNSQDDGNMIDIVCGFREDGSCETDFDELHQTDDDATPDDIEDDVVGDDTDNAPKDAEGTDEDPDIDLDSKHESDEFAELHQTDDDSCPKELEHDVTGDDTDNAPKDAEGTDDDPFIDLAMGESVEDEKEISANGIKGDSDADDFYPDDIRDEEKVAAQPLDGPDVNMDEEDIDKEFDKLMESLFNEEVEGKEDVSQTSDIDYEDNGLVGDVGVLDKTDDNTTLGEDGEGEYFTPPEVSEDDELADPDADSMDDMIDGLTDECNEAVSDQEVMDDVADEDDDDSVGDSDLIDMVIKGGYQGN